jgi:hypothetical protein
MVDYLGVFSNTIFIYNLYHIKSLFFFKKKIKLKTKNYKYPKKNTLTNVHTSHTALSHDDFRRIGGD